MTKAENYEILGRRQSHLGSVESDCIYKLFDDDGNVTHYTFADGSTLNANSWQEDAVSNIN